MGQVFNLEVSNLNKSCGLGSRRMAALHSLAQYRRKRITIQRYELIEGIIPLDCDMYAITDLENGVFLIKGIRKNTDEPTDYDLARDLVSWSLEGDEEFVEIVDNFTVELVEEEQLILVNLGPEWLIEIKVDEQNNTYSVEPNPKLANRDLINRLVAIAEIKFKGLVE